VSELLHTWAGLVSYQEAYQWQENLVARRSHNEIPDVFLTLEHPPTYTAGTRTLPEHLPQPELLAAGGVPFFRTNRGGSITYHGPGQLVGYPIVHLASVEYDLHRYLRLLEEVCLRIINEWGILGRRDPNYTGVWVGEDKIASIGVRVTHRVAMHGFALNIRPDLTAFQQITTCGIQGRGVTSLAKLGVKVPSLPEVAVLAASHLTTLLKHQDWRTVPCDDKSVARGL
jgi:lipoate-protein ligase B